MRSLLPACASPKAQKNGRSDGNGRTHLYLNVYDLTPMNNYLYLFGLGVFHSGIQGAFPRLHFVSSTFLEKSGWSFGFELNCFERSRRTGIVRISLDCQKSEDWVLELATCVLLSHDHYRVKKVEKFTFVWSD